MHPEMHTEAPGQQKGQDRVSWRRRIPGKGMCRSEGGLGSLPKHREQLRSDRALRGG